MANNLFCLYAFGRISSLNQAVYCLLTLKAIYQNNLAEIPIVLLFTDNGDYFKEYLSSYLEFKIVNLDEKKLKEWKGEPADNFRIKLKSLEYACENYPNSNIILADSDTFLLNPLTAIYKNISSGVVYFHADEGLMNENKTVGQKNLMIHFAENQYFYQGKEFKFPESLHLYNAGLIGVQSSKIQAIKKAIDLHDELYRQHRLYFCEQLSIIYALSNNTTIALADDVVAHYWYIKEFDEQIERVLIRIKNSKMNISTQEILNVRKYVPSYKEFKSVPFKLKWKLKNKLIKIGLLHKKFRWN